MVIEFQFGDIVSLHGHRMTVRDNNNGMIRCAWTDKERGLRLGDFSSAELRLVDRPGCGLRPGYTWARTEIV